METALENLSKEDLLNVISSRDQALSERDEKIGYLECEPARFFIKRYIRFKYAAKNGEGVRIAELPEWVIDKGIPGSGLLAMILTDKYVDHLPLYRKSNASLEKIYR